MNISDKYVDVFYNEFCKDKKYRFVDLGLFNFENCF